MQPQFHGSDQPWPQFVPFLLKLLEKNTLKLTSKCSVFYDILYLFYLLFITLLLCYVFIIIIDKLAKWLKLLCIFVFTSRAHTHTHIHYILHAISNIPTVALEVKTQDFTKRDITEMCFDLQGHRTFMTE